MFRATVWTWRGTSDARGPALARPPANQLVVMIRPPSSVAPQFPSLKEDMDWTRAQDNDANPERPGWAEGPHQ